MDKLGDIELFVKVIKCDGLAAAGRELGLSPARVTARINGLEQRYNVRLLNRTTRKISLTDEGKRFHIDCERILSEVQQAEESLQSRKSTFTGLLRISAPSDLGQQHISQVLAKFLKLHPGVIPYLYLSDGVIDVVGDGVDVAVRYGKLEDSGLIAQKLANNRRVLCASPDYINRKGIPLTPEELEQHDCLAMVRVSEPLVRWHFQKSGIKKSVAINTVRASNDGALIRRWAIEGEGIALKSYYDIADDLIANRLVTVMDNYQHDFNRTGISGGADLHAITPNRKYIPERTIAFINALKAHFSSLEPNDMKQSG